MTDIALWKRKWNTLRYLDCGMPIIHYPMVLPHIPHAFHTCLQQSVVSSVFHDDSFCHINVVNIGQRLYVPPYGDRPPHIAHQTVLDIGRQLRKPIAKPPQCIIFVRRHPFQIADVLLKRMQTENVRRRRESWLSPSRVHDNGSSEQIAQALSSRVREHRCNTKQISARQHIGRPNHIAGNSRHKGNRPSILHANPNLHRALADRKAVPKTLKQDEVEHQ